jgi:hypothetical protein
MLKTAAYGFASVAITLAELAQGTILEQYGELDSNKTFVRQTGSLRILWTDTYEESPVRLYVSSSKYPECISIKFGIKGLH